MGGSLQPFFAQRNMEAEAAMSSNSYLAPAAEGRTDAELARSVAVLEHQQHERQRRASQQQQMESDAEMARRVAYQQAKQPLWQQQQYQQQPMPPLPGTNPAAHSMSGSAPPRPPSVPISPYQPLQNGQHSLVPQDDAGSCSTNLTSRRSSQPLPQHDQHQFGAGEVQQQGPHDARQRSHRRSASSETVYLPEQRHNQSMLPAAGMQARHQRSVSYDAAMQPHAQTAPLGKPGANGQLSQAPQPSPFLETHQQMLDAQHRRAASNGALPNIRITKEAPAHDRDIFDPVAHVLGGIPPPASPMAGGGEPTTRQPTQTWNNGSGAHWDSEIARQMSGQHLVALQPRINSSAAMNVPPESSAQARARLERRLKLYGLCERKIKGDGACQFRSVSDQLYRTQDHHAEVRRVAVHQLRSNFYKYSEFVPSDYWKYVYDMEQSDTWGDHICLQAIADAYGLKINIITSYPQQDSCFIGITPDKVKTHRILYLSFWAEIHYNSIYPKSEPPASEKFWGSKKLARWLA